ncbi:siroheme synthase CysG [Arenicella chitinivorans]
MQHFPIFVTLNSQPCLVVGGGPVALRKIRLLRKADAAITVVAPAICTELESEFGAEITHIAREFNPDDIGGYRLIIAATNVAAVNQRISELAQAVNVPVNVVDQPDLCSFITPSIIDRSPVLIAVSTGGQAPVLARTLRTRLEAFIPASYGTLASAMGRFRDKLKGVLPEETDRRRFWDRVVNGAIGEMYLSGRQTQADERLADAVTHASPSQAQGEVWLVGAGPGDPDLLTFRALRLMQQADVVLYDRLVSPEILELTRRDADRLYVGKARSNHAVPQEEINQLLLQLALEGKNVLRLKGGDPFIFGRGGEEISLLSESGVNFQIVPGITAASGCATYAGIPLTHRDHAQSCLFVTGHLKNNTVDLNWPLLATPNQTVVVYMGLIGLPVICQQLIAHGVAPSMPIALVEQGTTREQKVYTGTLETMPDVIANQQVKAPTLIIIGSVVSLHDKLAWFDGQCLASHRAATALDR